MRRVFESARTFASEPRSLDRSAIEFHNTWSAKRAVVDQAYLARYVQSSSQTF